MDLSTHLTILLIAAAAAAGSVLAMWATNSRVHWFWRGLAVWAFVAAMLPIRAYEPAAVFGIGLPLIVCLLLGSRFLGRGSSSGIVGVQFGLRDIFLAVFIFGMSLALLRIIVRSAPSLTAYAAIVPATSLAALAATSYWLTIGPRRIWAFGIVFGLVPLVACLLWPRITWLDNVHALGLRWDRFIPNYFSAIRVMITALVEYVAMCIAAVILGFAGRVGRRHAWLARPTLASIGVAWSFLAVWIYAEMLPLAPFPPAFRDSGDRGAEVVQVAARLYQLIPRLPATYDPLPASSFSPSIGKQLNELYDKVLPLLDGTNSMPFDAQVDLTEAFFQHSSNRVQCLRELCKCFIAECDEAESKSDRRRALDMAIANLRLGTMCCRNGTSIEAQTGCAYLEMALRYFSRTRATFTADEAERVKAAIGRVEVELEPVKSTQQRELAFSQREFGWQGRLSAFVARGEGEKIGAQAVQLTRHRWEALSRLLLTDLTIRRFNREHGTWPVSLEELVPSYIPTVPSDPYSGAPLIYRVEGEEFVLYSVGRDGKDNGGQFSPFNRDGYDLDLDTLTR